MSAGRFEWTATRHVAVDAATGIRCTVERTASGAWAWELRVGVLIAGGIAGSVSEAKGEAHKRVERVKAGESSGEEKRR